MKKLSVGDTRQKGDQVRLCAYHKPQSTHGGWTGPCRETFIPPRTVKPIITPASDWEPVKLIGHKILKSDLMVAEFQRP